MRSDHNSNLFSVEEKLVNLQKPTLDKFKDFIKLTQWDHSKPNYYRLKETTDKSHRQLNKLCKDFEVNIITTT
jgi:hypothetical protein